MTKYIITLMLIVFGVSEIAAAQDLPTAHQRGNVNFIDMVQVKYKAGMSGPAAMHINRYFRPAAEAAGVPQPIILHMQTGPYDAVFFWNHGNSMGAFDWPVNENDEKFWAKLAELNGGAEAAQKLMADYQAMIANTTNNIGHRHLPAENN